MHDIDPFMTQFQMAAIGFHIRLAPSDDGRVAIEFLHQPARQQIGVGLENILRLVADPVSAAHGGAGFVDFHFETARFACIGRADL